MYLFFTFTNNLSSFSVYTNLNQGLSQWTLNKIDMIKHCIFLNACITTMLNHFENYFCSQSEYFLIFLFFMFLNVNTCTYDIFGKVRWRMEGIDIHTLHTFQQIKQIMIFWWYGHKECRGDGLQRSKSAKMFFGESSTFPE